MPKKPTGVRHFTEFSKVQINTLPLPSKNFPNPTIFQDSSKTLKDQFYFEALNLQL